MTVCIAAICDISSGQPPKIIFCADKMVSTFVQYESGESKIKQLTDYCYVMQSSNDSLATDLILERAKEKIKTQERKITIQEIVDIVCQECLKFKNDSIEKEVLAKYNLAVKNLNADPNVVVKDSINEIKNYQYELEHDLIVFGIEHPSEAHIFKIDQDGEFSLWDSSGFATAGSGGPLAYLEMTKYRYDRLAPLPYALHRVYFSKKISERAGGISRYAADFGVLWFAPNPKTGNLEPAVFICPPELISKFEEVFKKIQDQEASELSQLNQDTASILWPKPKKTNVETAKK